MSSNLETPDEHVYSLDELPRAAGDLPPEPFDSYMAQIQAYGDRHPDAYAGAFLSGAYIYVGVTAQPGEHLLALRRILGGNAKVRIYRAEFSKEELLRLTNRISQDLEKWRARRVEINSVSVNEYLNRVEIMLASDSATVVATFREAYSETMLTFTEGTITAV